MELATFGAVLRCALDLEAQAASFYERIGAQEPQLGAEADAARQRLQRLERARREMVSEMLLESISDLDDTPYQPVLDPTVDAPAAQALYLEGVLARFYRDAGAKMPVREVARLFARLAAEHEQVRDRL